MFFVSADEIDRALAYPALIDAIDRQFAAGIRAPTRHHHTMTRSHGADGTLLLMPAWSDFETIGPNEQSFLGVKIVTVNPDNNALNRPAVMGTYLLSDGKTGETLAILDGQALTARRTAAASALASRYLSRPDASSLTMIGAGALAPQLIRAHAAVRPIRKVSIWNRNRDKAQAVVALFADDPFDIRVADDREAAVRGADIVSAATISDVPLIEGDWLRQGTHVDLVGAFTPRLRESDDAAVRRATLFVDTFDGALSEGGDLVQPLQAGVITREDVKADLAMLARGQHPGRRGEDEITLFKSTGTALEDFAAGVLVYRTLRGI